MAHKGGNKFFQVGSEFRIFKNACHEPVQCLLILGLLSIFYYFFKTGRPSLAGFALGLAFIKPQLAIVVVIFLAARGFGRQGRESLQVAGSDLATAPAGQLPRSAHQLRGLTPQLGTGPQFDWMTSSGGIAIPEW